MHCCLVVVLAVPTVSRFVVFHLRLRCFGALDIFFLVDFIIKYFCCTKGLCKKHEWYSVLAFFSSYFSVCHSIIIYVIHIRYLFKCSVSFLFGKYSNKRTAYSLSKHETGNRAFTSFFDIAWIVVMSCQLMVFVQYPLFYTDSIGNVSIHRSPHHLPKTNVPRICSAHRCCLGS